MLIIGCGNRQRGDDAAGIIVAERLRNAGISTEICSGEAWELMELWSGVDDVIVIDAVSTGAKAGKVHVWDAQHPLPRFKISGSTHGLGVAEAIELGRSLGNLPLRLLVYGVESKIFDIVGSLSPEAERGVAEVVRRIVIKPKLAR